MHRIICTVIEYAFELPILPFVDNIEWNLEKEIDFSIEDGKSYIKLENTEICRKNFNSTQRTDVYLP